jgi:hypothetical protein
MPIHLLSPVPTSECPLCAFVRACDLPNRELLFTAQARFGPCAACGETVTAHGAFHPHDREACGGFVSSIVPEIV